jgi:hypothetical protein
MSSLSRVSTLNFANVTAPNSDHLETPLKLVLGVGYLILHCCMFWAWAESDLYPQGLGTWPGRPLENVLHNRKKQKYERNTVHLR